MASADKTPCCACDHRPPERIGTRRHRARRGIAAALIASAGLCLGARGGLRAEPRPGLSLDVFAGGGFDSNLFLQVAALPESPAYRPYSGWFGRLYPAVVASLAGDSMRLELSGGSDIRTTNGSGTLFMEDAQLALLVPELGPIGLQVAAQAGRFDATIDPTLAFSALGCTTQATWRASERWRARVAYRATWRRFGSPAQVGIDTDLSQVATVRLSYSPLANLDLAATTDYADLRSDLDLSASDATAASTLAHLRRGLVGLDASYATGARTSLFASTWMGLQSASGATTNRQAGVSSAVTVRTVWELAIIARYDFLTSWTEAAATNTAAYQRHVATLGVAGHVNAVKRAPGATPATGSQTPEPTGQGVRFRLRAGSATTVLVIGSWNDWATDLPGQRLRPTREAGLWEGWVPVPPGDHRYHFLVDGRAVRPADAARYRPDGFGGEDGVLEILP